MDKETSNSLSEYFKSQGIPESDTNWLIGFCDASQRKLTSLFAKNAKALLAQARQNGTQANDTPSYFTFAFKVKGDISSVDVVKAEYKINWSEPHSDSDGFMAEVQKDGRLAIQGSLFDEGNGLEGDLHTPGDSDAVEEPLKGGGTPKKKTGKK